jgi:hypothetical protein
MAYIEQILSIEYKSTEFELVSLLELGKRTVGSSGSHG